ncbi:MAG: AraC family transcriptional regulator, partial [Clostridia bacterium]
VAYINKNFAHALTIEDISASVGFSKYYLCRMFKELTGQTVFEYLNFVRCVRAKLLLGTGEYNVSQVAELCGFSNLSYFTKQYKRNVGTLPSKEKASSPKT